MRKVKLNRLVNIPGVGACESGASIPCTDELAKTLVEVKGFGEYDGKAYKNEKEAADIAKAKAEAEATVIPVEPKKKEGK